MALVRGEVDVPYRFDLSATGGRAPYTWTLASGTLPPGLVLSASGTIAGLPIASGVSISVSP